jgi:peptide/nickel transport system substrate-binding protein
MGGVEMKLEKGRNAVSTSAVVAVIVIIVLAALIVYFYTSQQAPQTTTQTTTPTPTTTTTQTVSYKDTIVIGTTDSVQSTIDPADAYDYFGDNIIQNLGAGLVDYRPGTTQIVPALATSWTVSPDGKTWTFNLRQGVKFPDGTPFNASVVKYSIDRQFKIDEPEGPFAGVGLDTIINRTVVNGPYQVSFVLNSPTSFFLSLTAFIAMYPVNPNVAPMDKVVNYTGNVNTENPNGLGPYMLTNWVRSGGKDVEMDLTANPYYWNSSAGYPKTKNIVIKFFTDSGSLNLALQSGQIDIAYRQLNPTDIQAYQSNPKFKVWTGPGTFIQYLVFNEKQKPFDNVLVRKAIAAAIDRSLIVNNVFLGQVQPLYSMIPAGMQYHADAFKVYGDGNVTYAQKLLQQAGYSQTNKLTFTLTYPTGHYQSTDGIAQAIKQALEKTGMISVNLASQPWPNYRQSTSADELQVYIYGWYPDFVDPFDYTNPFLPADGIGFLHTHYVNPEMTQLIQKAGSTSDTTQLASIYQSIQQLLASDAPIVPLFQGISIAVSSPKVGGIVLDATTIFRYWLLWETV